MSFLFSENRRGWTMFAAAKRYTGQHVLTAALERLRWVFRTFPRVYLSLSGGKDSGLLLNLALRVAAEEQRLPLPVLVVDLEAQYQHTAAYIERCLNRPDVDPYWVCLPLSLRNAVSQVQPQWLCWDERCRDAWVRPLPQHAGVISDPHALPFFQSGMEFEDFVPAFGAWLAGGVPTCCLVGIRADESLNRFRTLRNDRKECHSGRLWTTRVSANLWNGYPIYDWKVQDIWTANGQLGFDYNRAYDLMHLAGVGLHQMRLCQPYGDDQRKGLYLFKILEPETWARVVNRVEGANFGNRYSAGQGHVLGNYKVSLPPGHTYKSYAKFLLATMPPYLAAHYRKKLLVFFKWWRRHRDDPKHCPFAADLRTEGLWPDWRQGFPDSVAPQLESGTYQTQTGRRARLPSWRRVVKTLLRNDYWCKSLSFSQTKRDLNRQLALAAGCL